MVKVLLICLCLLVPTEVLANNNVSGLRDVFTLTRTGILKGIQILNILSFGVTAFFLSLFGLIQRSQQLKRIGVIFLSVFAFFGLLLALALFRFATFSEAESLLRFELLMVIACTFFLLIKRPERNYSVLHENDRSKNQDNFGKGNDLIDF